MTSREVARFQAARGLEHQFAEPLGAAEFLCHALRNLSLVKETDVPVRWFLLVVDVPGYVGLDVQKGDPALGNMKSDLVPQYAVGGLDGRLVPVEVPCRQKVLAAGGIDGRTVLPDEETFDPDFRSTHLTHKNALSIRDDNEGRKTGAAWSHVFFGEECLCLRLGNHGRYVATGRC